MPLVKTLLFDPQTTILVWKITESYETLSEQIVLKEESKTRMEGMKSELHQRAFLSVRMILQQQGYTDFDLFYDAFGKPHLVDGKHISISHSHEWATVIISDKITGIDIEMQREKIIKIASKFVLSELDFLPTTSPSKYIKKLTVIWGIKESIFKIRNEIGISFKDHIQTHPFELTDNQGTAQLFFENKTHNFKFYFLEIEQFTLVYAFSQFPN